MRIGPRTLEQMTRLGKSWRQGEHILVTGPTGGGKTVLARQIVEQRIQRGGFVMVMVGKLNPDPTILEDYKGWTRWTKWKRFPNRNDNRVLLWPNTDKEKTVNGKRELQRDVFKDAFDKLAHIGKWTLQVDEGLYTSDPRFMNLSGELAMIHAMGRSSKLSVITLAQRPAHIPLIVYSSAAHVFAGRAREDSDRKRLAELGGRESARQYGAKIDALGRREFLWIPVATDGDTEVVDCAK